MAVCRDHHLQADAIPPTELEIMCSTCWDEPDKPVVWGEPVLDRSSPGVIYRCPRCLMERREEDPGDEHQEYW